MSLPANIVDFQGRLLELIIDTREYRFVENVPRLIYTTINSSRFVTTVDGKLFDIVRRQLYPVTLIDDIKDEDIVQVTDHDFRTKTLLTSGGSVMMMEGTSDNEQNWTETSRTTSVNQVPLQTLIPTSNERCITSIPNLDDVTRIKTSLVTIDNGIYYLYGTSLAQRLLIHDGVNVVDYVQSCLWINERSTRVIILLMTTGEIKYQLSTNRAWDEVPAFIADGWITMIDNLNQPSQCKLIEIGYQRGLINSDGEVSILDGVNGLIPIDIPLDCFKINQGRKVKSSRNVAL